MPRRKAPRVAALRLGAVEIPLARQLSAAEGHQAARLLPADALRVIVVVKDDVETLFHIAADLVVFPQQKKRDSTAEQTHHKPADGHARGKGDAGEDEDIDEGAAHIGGDLIIDADERQQMDAQHRDRRNALEVAVLLEPDELIRQHEDERQLHQLRGLDADREARELQPCAVARAVRAAEGRQQQEDEAEVEHRQPLPLFHDLGQVDHGDKQIQHHAQHKGAALNNHKAVRLHIAGGAVDHGDAEQRRRAAQRQQDHVRLLQHVRQKVFRASEHRLSFEIRVVFISYYSLPQEVFSVNGAFSLFFCFFLCYNALI